MVKEEKVVFDFNKLRGRIIEKYRTFSAFAEKIGWKIQYLSAKLNGTVAFTMDDIVLFVKFLEIQKEEIGVYFFTPQFQN